MSETEDQTAVTGPLAGLAAARRLQNLSVEDVARQLKLSVNQIKALEAGDFEKLPGPVFVRGFLRNYSRLLGLNPEEIMRSVASEVPAPSPGAELPPSKEIPFPPAKSSRWSKYALATLILAGALIAYELYLEGPSLMLMKPEALTHLAKTTQVAPEQSVAPAPVSVETTQRASESVSGPSMQETSAVVQDSDAATEGTASGQSESQATPESQTAPEVRATPESQSAPETEAIPEAKATPDEQVVSNADAAKPAAPVEHEVRLRFDKVSWVEIRDRFGKVIFSQLNMPGTEHSLYGEPPLSLVIGNAHAVRVMYDDNPVDLRQYTKVDVARLTLQ